MDATETLFDLIPLLEKKFMRPIIQHSKTRLSTMQIHTLTTLKERNICTMTTLANEILMQKQQLTPIIDKLVAEGYVQREHDQADRRTVRISLTASGAELLEEHRKNALQILNGKLACLDQTDLHCLHNALVDLSQIIQKLP